MADATLEGENTQADNQADKQVNKSEGDTGKKTDATVSKGKEEEWAGLPENLRKTADRYATKADAIIAIENFRKRESQVRVPGKDASEEERAAYLKAVGVPSKPEEYEFPELPKGQELTDEIKSSRTAWAKRFHELGVPKSVAKTLSKLANEDAQKVFEAQIEADKAFVKSQEEALRAEWKGDDYEKNKTLANRAFADIANRAGVNLESLTKIETKDGRFLMDRTEMVKLFAAIGREMAEGSLGPVLTDGERDTIEDQVRDVRKQISEAQASGDSKRANKLYASEQALLAKIKGNQPIVGSRGRAA